MIFNSPSASKMSFLGGTALRIIHGIPVLGRLDFDNFSLSADEFAELGRWWKRSSGRKDMSGVQERLQADLQMLHKDSAGSFREWRVAALE